MKYEEVFKLNCEMVFQGKTSSQNTSRSVSIARQESKASTERTVNQETENMEGRSGASQRDGEEPSCTSTDQHGSASASKSAAKEKDKAAAESARLERN